MGWTKKNHQDEATRLLAKADQYAAAGDAAAVKTLTAQVKGHKELAKKADG